MSWASQTRQIRATERVMYLQIGKVTNEPWQGDQIKAQTFGSEFKLLPEFLLKNSIEGDLTFNFFEFVFKRWMVWNIQIITTSLMEAQNNPYTFLNPNQI